MSDVYGYGHPMQGEERPTPPAAEAEKVEDLPMPKYLSCDQIANNDCPGVLIPDAIDPFMTCNECGKEFAVAPQQPFAKTTSRPQPDVGAARPIEFVCKNCLDSHTQDDVVAALEGLGNPTGFDDKYCFCEPVPYGEDDTRDGHESYCEAARALLKTLRGPGG